MRVCWYTHTCTLILSLSLSSLFSLCINFLSIQNRCSSTLWSATTFYGCQKPKGRSWTEVGSTAYQTHCGECNKQLILVQLQALTNSLWLGALPFSACRMLPCCFFFHLNYYCTAHWGVLAIVYNLNYPSPFSQTLDIILLYYKIYGHSKSCKCSNNWKHS